MPERLVYERLRDAVTGTAAAFRRRFRLQPAGGPADKVFPPTYVGAVYATEPRRIDGETRDCVILDSVQSQANRMEEALQQAVDEGRLGLPLVLVSFEDADLLDDVGRITSLEAPHRIADAILRDSLLDGTKFRKSEIGSRLDSASVRNATPVFTLSPVSLLLGMWDSHGPKGGLGAKFERAIASEIVAVGVEYGRKTGGRTDPLGVRLEAGHVYRREGGGWTLDEEEAVHEKGKPVKVGDGRPSEIGHGNVAPGFSEYTSNEPVPDPLRDGESVRQGNLAPGGVTMDYALQTTVLSLPALRRMRFPLSDSEPAGDVDAAGHTVLAALGLCASALAVERGYDLRSRCVLFPEEMGGWELLDDPGSDPETFTLDAEGAIELLEEAVAEARKAGLPWDTDPIVLEPSEELVQLVRRSQELDVEGDAGRADT